MHWIPVFFLVMLLISFGSADNLPKHWHESGGFATDIEGGLGGQVVKVTNLNNSGAGSLRHALNQSGKRLIVFEVGGVIDLAGQRLEIKSGNFTLAGQTAPKPGITLIKSDFVVRADNCVVSHIAIRLGDGCGCSSDAADIESKNVVFDHVAVSWGVDEGLSIGGASNVTLYKCYIAEGLSRSKSHPEAEHSKGSLIQKGTNKLSIIGSLYAHNCLRSPRLQSNAQCAMLNSAIYGWAPGKDDDPQDYNYLISMIGSKMSIVGNVALKGPESVGEYLVSGHKGRRGNAYMKDNIIKDMAGKDLYEYDKAINVLDSPPLWPEKFKAIPAHEAVYEVLRTVGPRPGERDPIDARIVGTMAKGTGKIIDSQDEVGGYPKYPETRHTLTVPEGAQAQQDWLDALEDKFAVDKEIDLSRIYPMVGSIESDKFRPKNTGTVTNKKSDALKIKVVQNRSARKHFRASFTLSSPSMVGLNIYDLAGNLVVHRPEKYLQAGNHELTADIQQVPAGLYICRFMIGNTSQNYLYYRF